MQQDWGRWIGLKRKSLCFPNVSSDVCGCEPMLKLRAQTEENIDRRDGWQWETGTKKDIDFTSAKRRTRPFQLQESITTGQSFINISWESYKSNCTSSSFNFSELFYISNQSQCHSLSHSAHPQKRDCIASRFHSLPAIIVGVCWEFYGCVSGELGSAYVCDICLQRAWVGTVPGALAEL